MDHGIKIPRQKIKKLIFKINQQNTLCMDWNIIFGTNDILIDNFR
jgi:hypothetical protein